MTAIDLHSKSRDELELILSVSELRGFPVMPPGFYQISANIEGVSFETESVSVSGNASFSIGFNEALCWKLDATTFKDIRKRQVPLFINVLADDEEFGHFQIDLSEITDYPEDNENGSLGDFFVEKATWRRLNLEEDEQGELETFQRDFWSLKCLLALRDNQVVTKEHSRRGKGQFLPKATDAITSLCRNFQSSLQIQGELPYELLKLRQMTASRVIRRRKSLTGISRLEPLIEEIPQADARRSLFVSPILNPLKSRILDSCCRLAYRFKPNKRFLLHKRGPLTV